MARVNASIQGLSANTRLPGVRASLLTPWHQRRVCRGNGSSQAFVRTVKCIAILQPTTFETLAKPAHALL